MSNSGVGAHILVFPYPAQGHLLPLLDLTHHLLLRNLTITILITPKNLHLLNPLLSKHPSLQTLVLPLPHHPSLALGIENAKDLPSGDGFRALLTALRGLYDPILHWFRSHPSPPTAILSDIFLGWTHHLACELAIPRILFSPSGPLTLTFYNCLWRDLPKRDDPNDPHFPVSFPTVPNSPTYPWYQISLVYRSYIQEDPDTESLRDSFLANLASWGIVFNSFTELDGVYLNHIKEVSGHDRVWAIGPLLPPTDPSGAAERGGSATVTAGSVISWLDACKDHSVVYVCFGSQAVLSNEQMEALASGLELSGARFVWCVKEATGGHVAGNYGVVPEGFEDRVEGRGLVIRGWAPQVLILSHRAVGAFLTHCGWNSVLEGIVAGVPMLAWPMTADQYSNARLLVDEVGMAVKVCEGADTIPNSAELAKAMAESVGEDKGRRVRAMELRKAALDAIQKGGTSFKDLDEFVKDLEAASNGSILRY